MKSQVSRNFIDCQAAHVSIRLPGSLHLFVQGRNGYFAVDLYDGKKCMETLVIGTKREVSMYLSGMVNALEIQER